MNTQIKDKRIKTEIQITTFARMSVIFTYTPICKCGSEKHLSQNERVLFYIIMCIWGTRGGDFPFEKSRSLVIG